MNKYYKKRKVLLSIHEIYKRKTKNKKHKENPAKDTHKNPKERTTQSPLNPTRTTTRRPQANPLTRALGFIKTLKEPSCLYPG
jgi:hypothetical protein